MQRFLYISGASSDDKEEEEEDDENRVSLRRPQDMQDADLKKSA
jgi:hypothetical protein